MLKNPYKLTIFTLFKCFSLQSSKIIDTVCKGEFTTNYDEIDPDTCYDIECQSGVERLSYIVGFIVVIINYF